MKQTVDASHGAAPPDTADTGQSSSAGGPATPGGSWSRRAMWRRANDAVSQYVGVGVVLLALMIGLSLHLPQFLTKDNFVNIADQNAVLLTVSVGMTFVLLIGGIDLSVGGIMALTSIVLWKLVGTSIGPVPAIVLVVVLGCLLGLCVNGVLIGWVGLSFLVVTIGTAYAFRGLAQVWSGGQSQSIYQVKFLTTLGSKRELGVPIGVYIALAVFVLAVLVLRYTGFGRMVYAVGGNSGGRAAGGHQRGTDPGQRLRDQRRAGRSGVGDGHRPDHDRLTGRGHRLRTDGRRRGAARRDVVHGWSGIGPRHAARRAVPRRPAERPDPRGHQPVLGERRQRGRADRGGIDRPDPQRGGARMTAVDRVQVGLLLPSGVPGVSGARLMEWATLIDDGPFSSLGVADRLVYSNHDCLTTLAAAAAVTSRVRLVTSAVVAPVRGTVVLAKQLASVAQLAPGRLSVGLAVGGRTDDYDVTGVPWSERGRILDEQLQFLAALNTPEDDEQSVGPKPGEIEILIGGASKPALRRLVRHGGGYISGGILPRIFNFEAAASNAAWHGAGRPGRPRLVAGTWFSRAEETGDLAERRLTGYLLRGGPPPAVNSGIARGASGIKRAVREFRDVGADEVLFFPLDDDPDDVRWLADVVSSLPPMPRGEPAFPTTQPQEALS